MALDGLVWISCHQPKNESSNNAILWKLLPSFHIYLNQFKVFVLPNSGEFGKDSPAESVPRHALETIKRELHGRLTQPRQLQSVEKTWLSQ